jgi:hypothetical protein
MFQLGKSALRRNFVLRTGPAHESKPPQKNAASRSADPQGLNCILMKLIAYKTFEYNCQTLVPAARTRDWMIGNKYPENHRTDWKAKPFESNL